MRIEERSYGGQLFRPKPEIHCEADGSLILVATAWGSKGAAKKMIQLIIDFYHSAHSDSEITSPFQKLADLSMTANNLRSAVMLASDTVVREDNKNEYLTGLELFAGAVVDGELNWVSVGQPHLLRLQSPQPHYLAVAVDSATDANLQAPLPNQFLGIYSPANFAVHSIKVHPQDRLALISRSYVPGEVFTLKSNQMNLENLSLTLAKNNPSLPFWIGILEGFL